ncbi:MAG: DUF6089 family protein, partial [Bacteroidota bacterium]
AQFFEVGVFTGASAYEGDIERSGNPIKDANLAYGLFGRYHFSRMLTFKAQVYRARISADDANAEQFSPRWRRNLSFRNDITEVAFITELNILGYQPYGLYEVFSPYIYAGIGAGFHNPQANFNDEWINLQPLGTEGQGIGDRPDLYSKNFLVVPFGFGVKVALNDKWNIGLDIGARYTGFDYLDDVSTTYLSRAELLAGTSHPDPDLVVALANRTGEVRGLGGEPTDFRTGAIRGSDEFEDWYYVAGITISYNFIDNGLVGARNRIRRRGPNCPGNKF